MTTHAGSIFGDRPAPLMTVFAAMTIAVLATGCSEQGSARQAAADAPVLIEVSQTYITVQNRAGLALSDVTVAVVVVGGIEFARFFPRIESSGQLQVLLSDLSSRDGTRFNRALMRPKTIRVRARDVVGKQYEVERPWD